MVLFQKSHCSCIGNQKRLLRKFICFTLFFTVLLGLEGCNKTPSCEEMASVFEENQTAFEDVAELLVNAQSDSFIQINLKNPNNERLYVIQKEKLWFSSIKPIREELYADLYNVAAPLFTSAQVEGIYCNSTHTQVEFYMKFELGTTSSIFYTISGNTPSIGFTVKEMKKIADGWYAVVSVD